MPKKSPQEAVRVAVLKKPVPKVRVQIYKDGTKEWRWRAVAANNKVIGTGGEGYKRRATMLKSLDLIFNQLEYTPYEEVEK